MVAKPLCPLYKNIIKPLDRARYPELRYFITFMASSMNTSRPSLGSQIKDFGTKTQGIEYWWRG